MTEMATVPAHDHQLDGSDWGGSAHMTAWEAVMWRETCVLVRDLTLQMHGPLKLARPNVEAVFRKENERMLAVEKRYVEFSSDQI